MIKISNPNISIIVPVYKVEKYLRTCVESILMQSYKDYELILVDDGSPDDCPAICDEYAAKYDFIKVVHKKNGGLSDARNAGIEFAFGEYVTFVDSDDALHEKYLEYLWYGISAMGAEMSRVGFKSFYNDEEIKKENWKGQPKITVLENKKVLAGVLYQTLGDVSACGLLLPMKTAKYFPFPFGKLYEDLYTTYNYYLSVKKVAFIESDFYFYRENQGSIMHQSMNKKHLNNLLGASQNLERALKFDFVLKNAARAKLFSNYCRIILNYHTLITEEPQIYYEIKSFLENQASSVFKDSNCRKKNRIVGLGISVFGVKFLSWMNWLYVKLGR